MALNASGPISLAGSTTGQSIAVELGLGATTEISLNQANVRVLAKVLTGVIVMPIDFWGKSNYPNRKAVFAYGSAYAFNQVSNTGVVASDSAGAGTSRSNIGCTTYGSDTGIFAFGTSVAFNDVSNTGVISSDRAGAGSLNATAGTSYGVDKGICAFGGSGAATNLSSLISNTGVVASSVATSGSAKRYGGACPYGGDKGIFQYGWNASNTSIATMNYVTNTGVVGGDIAGAGGAKRVPNGCGFGLDQGIMMYGLTTSGSFYSWKTSYVTYTNTGVVGITGSVSGAARGAAASAGYGVDTAIVAFGQAGNGFTPVYYNYKNLINNVGDVSVDTASAGSGRSNLGAVSYAK